MSSRVLRTASALALGAMVLGAARAAWRILPRTWVLEFQAGAPSSGFEKFDAIMQSAAIEGLGFLVLGVFLGLVALLLARVLARWQTEPEGGFASAWGGLGAIAALISVAPASAGTFVYVSNQDDDHAGGQRRKTCRRQGCRSSGHR